MANSGPPLEKDSKNYYHPSSEQEIIDMVKYANLNKLQLRVRGSGHSFARNIFTDNCTLDKVDVEASAPDGDNINLMLDKYANIESNEGSLVTVQAGICLGYNPDYPPESTLNTDGSNNGLLDQLYKNGLTFDDLGGVTRQTVSGFLSTGSSGGSTTYSIEDNVHALRIIDGTGEVYEVNRDKDKVDMFNAALVSMGLLGVLSKVTFKCSEAFDIEGEQNSSSINDSEVDIFDDEPSDAKKTGLTTFLTTKSYARILWWPQTIGYSPHGNWTLKTNERLQVWQAKRIKPNDKTIKPFKLFDSPEEMMLYSFLMTLMGNIDHPGKVCEIVSGQLQTESRFEKLLEDAGRNPQQIKSTRMIYEVIFLLVTGITASISSECRKNMLPLISTVAMNVLTNLRKSPEEFVDHAYLGLPMDNTADDIIVPTMFTEIWVPLSYATKATNAIREYFNGPISSEDRYSRTGNNAWELYAAKASNAWMSMSYSNGTDVWKDGAFRIDPYWFVFNNESHYIDLYRPIWIRLHEKEIPFRLHWGKIFPTMYYDKYDWRKIIVKDQYHRLADFLAIRKKKDPNGIFLSTFWRFWLEITD